MTSSIVQIVSELSDHNFATRMRGYRKLDRLEINASIERILIKNLQTDNVVLRCLAYRALERSQSANALIAVLRSLGEDESISRARGLHTAAVLLESVTLTDSESRAVEQAIAPYPDLAGALKKRIEDERGTCTLGQTCVAGDLEEERVLADAA